jgi:spore maturation protein CgeB
MRVVIFCHSLRSDWNHGNAHFLRGVASELVHRGHDVHAFEPSDAWSVSNLVAAHGRSPLDGFARAYPELVDVVRVYDRQTLSLDAALTGADVVLVHEWSDPALVAAIGAARTAGAPFVLLFHDTHHRSITDRAGMAAYDLQHYDGVLAFGDVIRDAYLVNGWARRAWTWHEAADTRRFHPGAPHTLDGDLVWIGNWGDDERTAEIHEFLIEPVRRLGLRARVYGVRYPQVAQQVLADAGIAYGGWLPNHEAPQVFARFRVTVHIPRRPYVESLPGIPTIRPFEALACGMPLVCARWRSTGGLFEPGEDFLVVDTGTEMTAALARLLSDETLRARLATHGRATVLARHTCAHRVDRLLAIVGEVRTGRTVRAGAGSASVSKSVNSIECVGGTKSVQ